MLVIVALGMLLCICGGVWYSHAEVVTGKVIDKWAEESCSTSTSTDADGNSRYSTSCTPIYYVQLEDGSIFKCFYGRVTYDKIRTGTYIRFTARGYRVSFPLPGDNSYRIATPEIFDFEVIDG